MITRPLDLQSRLSPVPRDLDFFAWVNVAVIGLFFGLLGSRFVLAPAVPIGLSGENAFELPQVSGTNEGAGPASVVVSYRRDNVILFEDGMYTLPELRKHMEAYIKKHPGAVLLVRADRKVSWQAGLDLCAMAQQVGFVVAQVAVEPPSPESALK
jgi:biopolymer transport protein ExbD